MSFLFSRSWRKIKYNIQKKKRKKNTLFCLTCTLKYRSIRNSHIQPYKLCYIYNCSLIYICTRNRHIYIYILGHINLLAYIYNCTSFSSCFSLGIHRQGYMFVICFLGHVLLTWRKIYKLTFHIVLYWNFAIKGQEI